MRILIITGGSVEISFAAAFLKKYKYDKLFAVDKGVETVDLLGILPDVLLGDFDSAAGTIVEKYLSDSRINVIRHNPIKDATDTELAIEKAIEYGADDIAILGASGTRLDHTLGNIHCLNTALNKNISCVMYDKHNRIELINSERIIKKDDMFGRYVSFIPFTDTVRGLCLKGFKYELENYTLCKGTSLGVSNEVIDKEAYISLTSGTLIYFQTND